MPTGCPGDVYLARYVPACLAFSRSPAKVRLPSGSVTARFSGKRPAVCSRYSSTFFIGYPLPYSESAARNQVGRCLSMRAIHRSAGGLSSSSDSLQRICLCRVSIRGLRHLRRIQSPFGLFLLFLRISARLLQQRASACRLILRQVLQYYIIRIDKHR